ncbi:hypothetical protein MKW92_053738 [Papaver armeniacum]|nr:hypothetical protein MKW92_053738 [Papaver armeniacum]
MATTKTLCLINILLVTSILFRSMTVNGWGGWEALSSDCLGDLPIDSPDISCAGSLLRWRYSPTDDVRGDCQGWCASMVETEGVQCAQMNSDENNKVYCACYDTCIRH